MVLPGGHQARFETPVIPDSECPALWGLKSLKTKRAVIDVPNLKLYLMGPGDYKVVPCPGTMVIDMETANTGHLMVPITEYESAMASDNNAQKHFTVALPKGGSQVPGTAQSGMG